MEKMEGFESFELLRPIEGERRYFVYTRWESEEAFQAWLHSDAFTKGHAGGSVGSSEPADGDHGHGAGHPEGHPGGHPGAHGSSGPVGTGSALLGFEVVMQVTKSE